MDNKQVEDSQTYSRLRSESTRAEENEASQFTQDYKVSLVGRHKFYIFLMSLVLALTSVANPLLTDFGNAIQLNHLYTGQMMGQGVIPYQDIFASGGFVYYALIALSYLLGSSAWLMILEFLAFYMSGIYLYKIIAFLTDKTDMGMTFTLIFYLLNLSFGFGGLYPIQLAFPFILDALWFLTKYFAGHINDEAFIIYGFFGSLAALIEPRSLIFWLLSFLAIGVYNFSQRHFARGFYQLLCMVFGAILVYYSVGYFVFNMGNLEDYVNQALVYNFTSPAVSRVSLLISLPYQLLILVASGLLWGAFAFVGQVGQLKTIKWLIFLNFVLYVVMGILSQTYYLFQLLLALPFGLILTALVLSHRADAERAAQERPTNSHRRKRNREAQGGYWSLFAKTHFQLPVLVMLVGLLLPIGLGIAGSGLNQERTRLADYLQERTSRNSRIYVWDNSAKIYLATKLKSASQFPLPRVNTARQSNYKKLTDDLIQDNAKFIVVNNADKLPKDLTTNLKGNYEKVSLEGVGHFTLYQKK